jgi:hypothetical protein
MKSSFEIAGRMVGKGQPCYVIAEAGVNHNCDLQLGLRLVDEAHTAGADAIKFQNYTASKISTRVAPRYWVEPQDPQGTQWDTFAKLDKLKDEDFARLLEHARRIGLRLPGLHGREPGSQEQPTEDLACPLRLGSDRVAALALLAGGLHLSPCAELARSRRQRYALPKLDERETLDNDCEREACLQNLVRQSELALRRCGYTGMDLERACDDHLAAVAAFVEIGGSNSPGEPVDSVTALVVPDASPILQSANIDLRNSAAQVDGVIGVSLLRRLQTVIDYPQHRLELTCRCTARGESGLPQRCQTYRGVSYSAADGCSPNSTLLVPRNFARTACN